MQVIVYEAEEEKREQSVRYNTTDMQISLWRFGLHCQGMDGFHFLFNRFMDTPLSEHVTEKGQGKIAQGVMLDDPRKTATTFNSEIELGKKRVQVAHKRKQINPDTTRGLISTHLRVPSERSTTSTTVAWIISIISFTKLFTNRKPVVDENEEAKVLEQIIGCSTLEVVAADDAGWALKLKRQEARSLASRRLESIQTGQVAAPSGDREGREHSAKVEETLRGLHAKTLQSKATTREYWEQTFAHGLKVYDDQYASTSDFKGSLCEQDYSMMRERLEDNGFFSSPSMDWGEDISFEQLIGAMKELKSCGWPACFVFAYQQVHSSESELSSPELSLQPWRLIDKLFDFAEEILRAPCPLLFPVRPCCAETDQLAIEPSVFAWHLGD
eukprot:253238-Hanusia_phi.AAC.5